MRIEQGSSSGSAVFLFAHQDDEFGVFQSIERDRARGLRIRIAYLTTGVSDGRSPIFRNAESLRVLSSMGIPAEDIVFAGSLLTIADGSLSDRLTEVVHWLTDWLKSIADLERLYVPAWEGGHPDHDSLHAAALIAASRAGCCSSLRQFPLYNAYLRTGPFFRVMCPLPDNGTVERVRIPWRNRLRFLRNCLQYPSQARSWLGLFPFAAFHYLVVGAESLQHVSLARLRDRPHVGSLYYERRRFSTWQQVSSAVNACLRNQPAGSVAIQGIE
jgi:LmbE family N-acetylglucosaminyl deacetylase